jgi:ATP-dependent Clp protease ATP-binding subunit ClpC
MENNIQKMLKLSENARFSLRLAIKIANESGDLTVKPLHIFIGVLLNEQSIASKTLVAVGLDPEETAEKMLKTDKFEFTIKDLNTKSDLKLSKDAKDILRGAYAISSQFKHVYIGTEHIILAILQQKQLQVTKSLEKSGLTYDFFKENLMNFATYPIGILAKPSLNDGRDEDFSPLELLGEDLVERAIEGELDPLVGREEELSQIINVLSRRRKNNPVIVGDPGVGKTALIEGLSQLIAAGTVPNSLLNMRIVSLDIGAIMAGSKLRGDVEERIIDIVNEVSESPDIILFIDEIHNILNTNFPGGGMDIAAILKPALLQDNFRVIGATTTTEYTRYFEEDNALARRFQPIVIDEPSVEETIEILHRVEPLLEKHHDVNITDKAIVAAVKLSDRYVSDRFLPDKAIDLLDEAAASRKLELEVKYKDVADLIGKYQKAVKKKEESILAGDMVEAKKWRSEERKYKLKINSFKERRTKSRDDEEYLVGVRTVQQVISKWTGIPLTTIDRQETAMLKNLEKQLGRSVVGQKEAVESVSSAIKRARTGISDEGRPWSSLLFLGPTGVGKTELAKVLTKQLFGDEDRLIQIDMSEMMEMHSISKLIGSPPGYVGYREGGQLTEKIRKYPHSVILFDEIEKAHPDILNILLQIMEYGHLTDGKGRKVDFKNTVVILTSNIGAEEIQKDKVLGFGADPDVETKPESDVESAYEAMKEDLLRELKSYLRPELLNRLDDVVIFRSLTRRDARKIVTLLIEILNDRLKEHNIGVELTKGAKDYVVTEGFSEEYGARNLRRVLQDSVENIIADYLIENGSEDHIVGDSVQTLEIECEDGELKVISKK